MKKKLLSVILTLVLATSTCITAGAAENPAATKNGLRSSGSIRYFQGEDSVVVDSADLYTLADRLDLFKVRAVKQLGAMNTYLTKSGGGVSLTSADGVYAVHRRPYAGEEVDPLNLDFAAILEGIAVSQSIPTDPASYGMSSSVRLYKTPEGKLVTTSVEGAEPISIQAATADNLSAGAAAWVNGKLLLGTGGDMADAANTPNKPAETPDTPNTGSSSQPVKHNINSGYTTEAAIDTAFAYVYTTGHGTNDSAGTPVFSMNGGGSYYKVYGNSYGRNGFNVKVTLYVLKNIPKGATIKGSNGIVCY